MEALRAVERSPVSHKCSTLIRVIHFIICLFVLALSNMQHADSTGEDKKGMLSNNGNEWVSNMLERKTRRKTQLRGHSKRMNINNYCTFSVSVGNSKNIQTDPRTPLIHSIHLLQITAEPSTQINNMLSIHSG